MSTPLRVELYGGEDYRIYDGVRLVATVYAEADLPRLLWRADKACSWAQDGVGEDHWDTGCRKRFTLMDGSPSENRMRFCCYCGGDLIEQIAEAQP